MAFLMLDWFVVVQMYGMNVAPLQCNVGFSAFREQCDLHSPTVAVTTVIPNTGLKFYK